MLKEHTVAPALGTTSLEQEVTIDDLSVDGSLPAWLEGTLIRNGPARFEAGERPVRHWFDGLAMLHRFTIDGGRVSYSNRFLRTKAFAASEEGRIGYREFATDPCRSLFGRIASIFSPGITDNAFINVVRSGEEFIAMSETPMPIAFDPRTLETLGVAKHPPGQLPTAHPHADPQSGELINLAVHLGPRSSYRLYAEAPGGARRIFSKIPVREPAYIHSFGLTERYVVLAFGPLVVNPIQLATSGRPFIENYRWEPERGSEFLAVDRTTGKVVQRWKGDPLFLFHHINAYEEGDEIVVDLCGYDDAQLIEDLYLERLRGEGDVAEARPRRYRLPLAGGRAEWEALADVELELPRIDPRRNGRPHSVAWGTSRHEGRFGTALARLDVDAESTIRWHEPGCHPGEPVFIPRPDGVEEDDGVLLSVVLDATAGRSFLLALDAATLDEVARAELPHHVPFGIHGQFFGEVV
jgi:carotenoid cleavage dioxygenase-like enzyme